MTRAPTLLLATLLSVTSGLVGYQVAVYSRPAFVAVGPAPSKARATSAPMTPTTTATLAPATTAGSSTALATNDATTTAAALAPTPTTAVAPQPTRPSPPVANATAPAHPSPPRALAAASNFGCAAALAYLAVHQAPGFVDVCRPHAAVGHYGYTCVNVAWLCRGVSVIAIACPAPVVYMNEASNSFVLSGRSRAPIDPFGQNDSRCPAFA